MKEWLYVGKVSKRSRSLLAFTGFSGLAVLDCNPPRVYVFVCVCVDVRARADGDVTAQV